VSTDNNRDRDTNNGRRPPSAPMRITLIRHGHVLNPDNVIYGRLPGFMLSEVGRQQAEAAAAQLRHASLSALFASPQQRALETATIVQCYHSELSIETAALMDEIRCYFEGHPAEVVEARGWDLYTGVQGDFETPEDIAERGAQFVTQARATFADAHIAVVTHGDVIAFTLLHEMRDIVHVSRKRTLARYGITDSYPATASLTTLTYRSTDPDEIPDVEYVRPYGADLTLDSLS
jgi:broad specificity phosphatase PhoE